MLGIELEQTRVFQDAKAEGRLEGKEEGFDQGRIEESRSFVMMMLNHKFGNLSGKVRSKINNLSIEQTRTLGEALLDFRTIQELKNWLKALDSSPNS
jgi:predicted transposase YdaD